MNIKFNVAIIWFIIIGCKGKSDLYIDYQPENSELFKDSLALKNIGEIKLDLAPSTTFFNKSVVFVRDSSGDTVHSFFSIYNERKECLENYSLTSKKLDATIFFSQDDSTGVGHRLANTAHFYLSNGEIAIFNYWKGRLNIFTGNGSPKKSFLLAKNYMGDANLLWPMINTEYPAFQIDRDIYINNHFLDIYKDQSAVPVLLKLNLDSGKVTNLFYRPNLYNYGFWGGVDRYMSSFIINDENKILINFPVTPYIYQIDIGTKKVDSFYVGSKYFKSIDPLIVGKKSRFTKTKDEIAAFTLTSPLFRRLIFDKKNQLYYRIVLLPRSIEEYHTTPYDPKISIIIFNKKFEKLGETLLPDKAYYTPSMIMNDFGLLIPNYKKYRKDPTHLSFDIFNILKKEK